MERHVDRPQVIPIDQPEPAGEDSKDFERRAAHAKRMKAENEARLLNPPNLGPLKPRSEEAGSEEQKPESKRAAA